MSGALFALDARGGGLNSRYCKENRALLPGVAEDTIWRVAMNVEDKAGNEARQRRREERLWRLLECVWHHSSGGNLMDGRITEIRIRKPDYEGGPVKLVIKGLDESGKYVGFSEGIDTPTGVLAVLDRIKAGQMKWREDKPYQPRLQDGS